MNKLCTKCKSEKSLDAFSYSHGKLYSWCKECRNIQTREWREKNGDILRTYYREYYWRNRDDILPKARVRTANWKKINPDKPKEWYLANRPRLLEKYREHYWQNREVMLERMRKWYVTHRTPERVLRSRKKAKEWRENNYDRALISMAVATRNRRARLLNASGSYTSDDVRCLYWFQSGRCQYCSKKLGRRYHVDHMVPLKRGGSNYPSNLCLSDGSCNSRKGTKTAEEFYAITERD